MPAGPWLQQRRSLEATSSVSSITVKFKIMDSIMIPITRTDIRLKADPRKVVLRYLNFGNPTRFEPVIAFVEGLTEQAAAHQLEGIFSEFEHRHFDLEGHFFNNYKKLAPYLSGEISDVKKRLLGAYFTHEYSIEAAALFNPSIVPHPDQSGLKPGELRFVLSLRAAGEGHISSVAFLTGVVDANGGVSLDPADTKLDCGEVEANGSFDKSFVLRRMEGAIHTSVINALPARFSLPEALAIIAAIEKGQNIDLSLDKDNITAVFDLNYDLSFKKEIPLSSRVIFPQSRAESNGVEDVRFVLFSEGGAHRYIGTYTAYNGKAIRPQLIETADFQYFSIRPLYGAAASDKGMALFPEKINGRYAMIGRQGGRSLSIMYSDDLYFWDEYQPLQHPQRDWEMLQMGNCGSPVKTPQGWLLLTHAVGPMRKYVLSMTLLDLQNPAKVLASMEQPLLNPNEEEREGYVPNVLYTCGMLLHKGKLVIPYAMSDNAVGFAVGEIAMMV